MNMEFISLDMRKHFRRLFLFYFFWFFFHLDIFCSVFAIILKSLIRFAGFAVNRYRFKTTFQIASLLWYDTTDTYFVPNDRKQFDQSYYQECITLSRFDRKSQLVYGGWRFNMWRCAVWCDSTKTLNSSISQANNTFPHNIRLAFPYLYRERCLIVLFHLFFFFFFFFFDLVSICTIYCHIHHDIILVVSQHVPWLSNRNHNRKQFFMISYFMRNSNR